MNFDSDFWQDLYQQSQLASLVSEPLADLRVNHDLQADAMINASTVPWVSSPAPGVRRIVLERDGGEHTTRATSLVAYRAGSRFAAHVHPKGEEILVLCGVFSDENGHYPAGSYLRNPPGSAHAPFSDEGCLIFVKLQQFSAQDTTQLALSAAPVHTTLPLTAVVRQVLFQRPDERVELVYFVQTGPLPADLQLQGLELLVLKGGLTGSAHHYPVGTWLRDASPETAGLQATAGTQIYVKYGHLGRIA
ncbi:cupin domain-containing protein [Rhodoferax sp. PAMC 29310]|uniref:cupin domain-containing protein n=1 Tax=Rhodoferax sp. PAMC 29310 TaxID=2822760 RepID=UPI001B33CEDA|nr:cupin domain-containing protein [Rhodoferax sp. PAMC 29310]